MFPFPTSGAAAATVTAFAALSLPLLMLRAGGGSGGSALTSGELPGAPVALNAPAGHRAAPGQPDPALRSADSLVADWVSSGRIPGAVLVVVRHGDRILEKAYGHAQAMDYGQGEYGASRAGVSRPGALHPLPVPAPMFPSTIFDLASVTKVMATTWAVMLLVDRGQVRLDVPVSDVLPDFRGGGRESITVRHLLSHTAGLQQWVPLPYHASTPEEAWIQVRDLPLGWPPGEGRHYSDLGFMVLGRLVERVGGRPLDTFLQDELYGPLGLEDTGFRPPGAPVETSIAATSHGNPYEHRMVHDPTFGYRIPGDAHAWDGWRRRTLVGEVNDGNAWHAWGGVAGHAGLFSTGRDLSVLLQLLLDGGVHAGREFVRPETIETFLAPVVEGQALGWQRPSWAPSGSVAHSGFTGTWVMAVPSRGLGIVLLTNRQNRGVDSRGLYPDVGPLQRGVSEALLTTGADPPG